MKIKQISDKIIKPDYWFHSTCVYLNLWFGALNGSELGYYCHVSIMDLKEVQSVQSALLRGSTSFWDTLNELTRATYVHLTETDKFIFFSITIVTRSTLWDVRLGWCRDAMKNAVLVAQRGTDTTAHLPLCHNKWYILNLKSYDSNFTSRITFVTWINLSRFLFWLGFFKRYILFRISFLICILETFYFLSCALN